MPQWSNSNRRERLPPEWPAIRRRILKRDNRECQHRDRGSREICGDFANEVDHIQHGDDHSDGNLQALCSWHHARKSSSEGGAARAVKRRQIRSKYRRTEDHPGLL